MPGGHSLPATMAAWGLQADGSAGGQLEGPASRTAGNDATAAAGQEPSSMGR